jgi:predicted nucleic acid-binding protein
MIVVADTSPLNYLILIDCAHILEQLYGQVIIPQAVAAELQSADAPMQVREWLSNQPRWLEVVMVTNVDPLLNLDRGEREAIALAEQMRADLVLLDERRVRQAAISRGLPVTGTLGVLEAAAQSNLIELPTVIARLQQTSFRVSPRLLRELLARRPDQS